MHKLLLLLILLPSVAFAQIDSMFGATINVDATNSVNICSGTGDIRLATGCTGDGATQYTHIFSAADGSVVFGGVLTTSDLSVDDIDISNTTDNGIEFNNTSINVGGSGTLDLRAYGVDIIQVTSVGATVVGELDVTDIDVGNTVNDGIEFNNTSINVGGSGTLDIRAYGTDVINVNSIGAFVTGEFSASGVAGSGKAVCVKADGNFGVCSDAVGGSGTCTCG